MSRDERVKVETAVKEALFTSVNSTKKHLRAKGKDRKQLQRRIEQTLRRLSQIARELNEDGYVQAGAFMQKNAGFMAAFAELALEGNKIPYTTNKIERLMGETIQ